MSSQGVCDGLCICRPCVFLFSSLSWAHAGQNDAVWLHSRLRLKPLKCNRCQINSSHLFPSLHSFFIDSELLIKPLNTAADSIIYTWICWLISITWFFFIAEQIRAHEEMLAWLSEYKQCICWCWLACHRFYCVAVGLAVGSLWC